MVHFRQDDVMIRRKYFMRLFIIYISFTLVYGFIISSFFVVQNKTSMDKQELDNSLTEITQHSRNIDQRITSFVKYVDTLYLDSEFKDYLINNDDYYLVTKLYDKLNRDMSVFSDIEGRITLSLVEDDIYISNKSTMNKSLLMEEYEIDSHGERLIYKFYEEGINREYMVLEESDKANLLFITLNTYSVNERVLIIQSINKEKLATLEDGEFFDVTVNKQGEESYEIIDDRLIYNKKSTVLPDVFYTFDFPYSKTSFFSMQLLIGFLIYLAIVAVGSVIAGFIARSTYKPIRTIMESFDEDNEDKQDEFAFLSRITGDIKKANDELKTTLSEQKIDLKTKVIRELIHGISDDEHLEFINQESNLQQLSSQTRMIIVNIEQENEYNEVYLSDAKNTINNNIYTIIENTLTLEGVFYEITELNASQFGIIIGKLGQEALDHLMSKLLNVIEVEDNVDIVFVVGSEVDSLINIKDSYQKALKVMEYRSNFDKRALIYYSDVESINLQSVYFYPIDLERELIIQTLQGQNKQIEQIFQRIYNTNFIEHSIDNDEKRKLVIDMIGTLRRIYQKMNHTNEASEELEVLKLFENNRYHVDELFERLKITFLNYSDIIRKRSHSKAVEYSGDMIKYIKEHYHEDISLEEVASHLNLSTGYFSTIFKKETGENFKGYLNRYRVKKSKEFLQKEPSTKIKDLSLKVGYFNVNSFIRMFKKYEGISPGEYAKNIKN